MSTGIDKILKWVYHYIAGTQMSTCRVGPLLYPNIEADRAGSSPTKSEAASAIGGNRAAGEVLNDAMPEYEAEDAKGMRTGESIMKRRLFGMASGLRKPDSLGGD